MKMSSGIRKNGIRYVKMEDWALILIPKKEKFLAEYYEKTKKVVKFTVSQDYSCLSWKKEDLQNDAIHQKIVAFLELFQKMDELEKIEHSFREKS